VYLKASGLVTWSKNCKWYGCLPLGAVVSQFFAAITLCVASQQVFIVVVVVYFFINSVWKLVS
jgi:hypothetical protein